MSDWRKDWKAGEEGLMHPPGGNRQAFEGGRAAAQHAREMADMSRRHNETMNQPAARPLPPNATLELPDDPAVRAAIFALLLAIAAYILVTKAFLAWLILTLTYALLGAAVVLVVVGTWLWGGIRLAGTRIGWLQAAWSATGAMLFGGVTAIVVAALAFATVSMGGPELIPGMREAVASGSLDALTPLDRTSLAAMLAPLAAVLGAGAWFLNFTMPPTPRVPRAVRWAGLTLLLLVATVAGVLLAIAFGKISRPADLALILSFSLLIAMGTAIAIATGLAAATAGILIAWLRRHGWQVSTPGDSAQQVALGFLAYCVLLILLMVLYRPGDNLVMGLGRLVTPWRIGSEDLNVTGLLGFLLLQAAPFGLFAAIASETQRERRALDRLRLALIAQGAMLLVGLVGILLFWIVLRFTS